MNAKLSPVLFIPHGAGPLPLYGEETHKRMVEFLTKFPTTLCKPSAILVISAHWEESIVTITSGETPSLLYDYDDFPDEAYQIQYPAKGNPVLADKIQRLLHQNGIDAKLDNQRGFDHGLFVPLKLMFPDASIPCVQLSLLNSLHAESHLKIGNALAELRKHNVLIVGSGFSFHNMRSFFAPDINEIDLKNNTFQEWLIDICTNKNVTMMERERRLIAWRAAPFATYCHPREEHLLPLHVCVGLSASNATLVFDDEVASKRVCAFLWTN